MITQPKVEALQYCETRVEKTVINIHLHTDVKILVFFQILISEKILISASFLDLLA